MQVRLAFSVAIKAQGDILIWTRSNGRRWEPSSASVMIASKGTRNQEDTILVTHDIGAIQEILYWAVLVKMVW